MNFIKGFIIFTVILLVTGFFYFKGFADINKEYTDAVGNYWTFVGISSTLEEKERYIKKYIDAVKTVKHAEHSAIWYQTAENNYDANVLAIESLYKRLNEIKNMDVKSFEYQLAIRLLTSQELGNTKDVVYELKEAWYLERNVLYFDWICVCIVIVFVVAGIIWITLGIGVIFIIFDL